MMGKKEGGMTKLQRRSPPGGWEREERREWICEPKKKKKKIRAPGAPLSLQWYEEACVNLIGAG